MRTLKKLAGLLCGALFLILPACGPDTGEDPDGGTPDGSVITTDGGEPVFNLYNIVVDKIEHRSATFHARMSSSSDPAAYFMVTSMDVSQRPLYEPFRVEATEDGLYSPTFTVTGLQPETEYWVMVVAFSADGRQHHGKRIYKTIKTEEAMPLFGFWKKVAEGRYRDAPDGNGGTPNFYNEVKVVENPSDPVCPILLSNSPSSSGTLYTCLNMETAEVYLPEKDSSGQFIRRGKIHFCNHNYFDLFDEETKEQFLAFVEQHPEQHASDPDTVLGCHDYSIQNEQGEYVDGYEVAAYFVLEDTVYDGSGFHSVTLKIQNPDP